ncbi:MAG: hypothetical protein F6J92_30910, partial [Symploca sp. SIO1A3]|nr:hypothetical protein [Symploca sp. SIO1A3]
SAVRELVGEITALLLWAALVGTAGKQAALPSRISSEPPEYLVQEGRGQEGM